MSAALAPGPLPNILVVDDTIENLRLLATILGEQGYEVRPVTNGKQALLAVEGHPPDLILLDVNMPEMDGYEVCARLKERPELRDIPVVFLTAMTDTADKVRAFEAGAFDYITKPFKVEEVLARVRSHIMFRRTQQELERSYVRLRELERQRDDLVHMVVHDMKSPLTVLSMGLHILRAEAAHQGGRAVSSAAACVEASATLERMVNDLLDVSRLESGKLPLALEPCDLVRVVEDVCVAVASVDPSRVIGVAAAGPVEVTCDPAIVRRVVDNLVTNSIKYSPAGSELRVSVAGASTRVRVEVQDEGPGIPPEVRGRIFEKFATAGTPNDPTFHSSGLGLAFCKLAVEAHGGTIGVDPAQPRGSVFWFELPA